MQHLEGSGTPVLYIGRTVLKGNCLCACAIGHKALCILDDAKST